MGFPLDLSISIRLLFLLFLFFHVSSVQPLCHPDELSALLQFKQSFVIINSSSHDYPKTESWKVDEKSGDCCSWKGVECDNSTGHVIGLDLSSSYLFGSINSSSSLFRLSHLQWLNLSDNVFNNSKIPSEIKNLSRLTFLDLSYSNFSGQVPSEILELSELELLDLSGNSLKLRKPGLRPLLEKLSNLNVLDLSDVRVSSSIPNNISPKFSSLSALILSNCDLRGESPIGIFELPSLRLLNLQSNPQLTGYLPDIQANHPLLKLSLANTSFFGQLPESIGNLKSLEYLDIKYCKFSGKVPYSLGNLTQLRFLDLSSNNFLGPIPFSVGRLNQLLGLDFSYNKFSEEIPSSLANLTRLVYLSLATNNFNRGTLSWLGTQTNLAYLDLTNTSLSGNITSSLKNLTQITCLVILRTISISDWKLNCVLNLSNNSLTGEISPMICNLSCLALLRLSDNNLRGLLPPCFGDLSKSLNVLNLQNNHFTGAIPQANKMGCKLKVIDLSQNQFQGKIPRSLVNCTMLEAVHLEYNQINDSFPSWLGTLPELKILLLRSNGFHGVIGKPQTKFHFPKLQIIDLSNNCLMGNLPFGYFNTWNSMKVATARSLSYMEVILNFDFYFVLPDQVHEFHFRCSVKLTNKGQELEYRHIPGSLTAIDLSNNMFSGEIPEAIGNLKALKVLNLSINAFIGHIPSCLGNLIQLESLDLSQNNLSGEIPQQLAQLTFLAFFNVSHNNLQGPIPQGTQFSTFATNCFDANSGLCGSPLSIKCGIPEASSPPLNSGEGQGIGSVFDFGWKVVAIGYGAGLIIGLVVGSNFIFRPLVNMNVFGIVFGKRHPRRE
ncbi:receptor-like protein 12 [Durio zibethinus]|uniref:Receptor-like protein 12 n=1 Tax=Durio zibethinus TaxID=66656 RepID=A0A6P5Y174_DURZI|nr:receptor-like protein 12 [Durio zibethinus]